MQRKAPEGYVEEWTELIAQQWQQSTSSRRVETPSSGQKPETANPETLVLVIFRIAQEWLALPVWTIKEITHPCPVHTLPHRSNHVLLGIVNIRGEILMCISLRELLGLPNSEYDAGSHRERKSLAAATTSINPVVYQRLVVMEIQGNRWVFPVDEIVGIRRFSDSELRDAPVVVAKTPDTYTQKIFRWHEQNVNYLNYELLFYELLFYTLNRT